MKMTNYTVGLRAPKTTKEFTRDWARKIIVDYMTKTDSEWLLADVLKVVDVTAKENSHPGMLSDSYCLEVTYKTAPGDQAEYITESWFAKVPKTSLTSPLDSVEVFMYKEYFPFVSVYIQEFGYLSRNSLTLPIPLVFHCYHDSHGVQDIIVMENLKDSGFKPLRPETCGLSFMRATMNSLATIHATSYAMEQKLGGKGALLEKFPLIKEDNLPRSKLIKDEINKFMEPYLVYLSHIQPDLQHQLSILTKFHGHIFNVFKKLKREMKLLGKCIVHGDSKIDNFLYKKNIWSVEDEYQAMMIDWQGSCYDFVSGDLMWALYGFMKNLPDKNSTVDTFLDYSLAFYHKEIYRLFNLLRLEEDDEKENNNNPKFLPKDDYDAVQLIHKGFIYEFLKTALIKPVLQLQEKDKLIEWFNSPNRSEVQPPNDDTMFKTGSHFTNFVHLYFTIATEIGVFHDLGSHCIASMRAAIFGGDESDVQDDSEYEEDQGSVTTVLSQDLDQKINNQSNDENINKKQNENIDPNQIDNENKSNIVDHEEISESSSSDSKENNNKQNLKNEFIEEETVNYTLKLESANES